MLSKLKKVAKRLLAIVRKRVQSAREVQALRRLRLPIDTGLASPPRRVAIIGCGNMGRTCAAAVRLVPGWSVSALCDSREAAMQALVGSVAPGSACHLSSDELFRARDTFDILVIATTAPSHVPLALAAIEAGVRAILVEKPVAVSLEEARLLQRAVQASGARVAIDHTRRWAVPGDGIAHLIKLGVIGRPLSVYCAPGKGGFSMIGTHWFDLLRWILADEPVRVRAEFDTEQAQSHRGSQFSDKSGRCEIDFSRQVRAVVELGVHHARPHGVILILGSAGRLEIDEKTGVVRLHGASGTVHQLDYPWVGSQGFGLAAALVELAGSSAIACSVDDGARALEVAIAANISARSGGGWVELPLSPVAAAERFAFP